MRRHEARLKRLEQSIGLPLRCDLEAALLWARGEKAAADERMKALAVRGGGLPHSDVFGPGGRLTVRGVHRLRDAATDTELARCQAGWGGVNATRHGANDN